MEMNIIKVTKENSTGNKKLDSCINKINSKGNTRFYQR